jgi:hypothetical protein
MPYSPSSEKVPRTIPLEVLERLVEPFLEEGPVFVALGCGRVYVAHEPSQHCKRCEGVHPNHEIRSLEDLREAELEKIDIYA